MKKILSLILTLAISIQINGVGNFINAADSTVTCSGGATSVFSNDANGVIIDDNITLATGDNLTGAKIYITTGFNSAQDTLLFTNANGITGNYDATKGVLTLTGTKTPEEYQAALRTIQFKTIGTGTRTIVFAIGDKIAYNNHYYEYVNNRGAITWTASKTAAASRTFYGSTGYLAVITSEEENNFLKEKLGSDAWIGASDQGTEGTWIWDVATAPEAGNTFYKVGDAAINGANFNKWNTDEPNDAGGAEDYGMMYVSAGNLGKWNDVAVDNALLQGYLVEYNSAVGASSTKDINIVPQRTLTYDGNFSDGGAVPAAPTDYVHNTSVTVLDNVNTLTKAGKVFASWNTAADGSGTTYLPGETFSLAANTTLFAIWDVEATITCSAGTESFILGSINGVLVDSGITITPGRFITTAKVYITTGFETTKDELLYTNAGGITGTYDAAKGVLSLTGTKTPADYQAALRTIRFKTSGSTGNRTIVYTLGTKLSYAGHFYEYVAHGGNITWTDAKVAAEGRYFYGSKGYLATITTQAENDFLRDKLGADAWIGASDSGVENTWKWAVDAPAAEAGVAFFDDTNGTTADGYFSNWNTNEPNNAGVGEGEDYAIMYCTGGTPGRWNDLPNDGSITGYLVEYNSAAGASSTKTLGVSNAPASTPSTPTPVTSTVIVIVNGVEQNAGTETKSTEEGKTVVTVEVNNEVIDAKIDEAIKKNPEGTGNVLQVPVADTTSDVVKVELTGDIIKKLEENTFEVSIKRDDVEYLIPAEEFTISDIAKDLGVTEASLKDIKIEVQITKLEPAVVAEYTKVAKANGAEIVFPPVAFEIIAKTTQTDGKTSDINISKFSNYVERIMEIPAGVDPSKITTGIVFNSDGTYSHVPTEVFQKDGKWYARLNSLTNSNYSVVWNPVTVASVENQWSKDAVNDMASRLVIFDPEKFSPNKAITRGDFAEYIVRALGLYREGALGLSDFKDVNKENQRALAIKIAKDYGIINGYGDGLFKPNQPITREESMAMYSRAMKITNLVGKNATRINTYVDNSLFSTWARSYAIDVLSAHVFNGRTSSKLSPKAYLTYAEAAQAIKNLLIESKLINK